MKKIIVVLCLVSGFVSCILSYKSKEIGKVKTSDSRYNKLIFDTKTGLDQHGLKFGNINFVNDEGSEQIRFEIYENIEENIRISLSESWALKTDEDYLLFAESDRDSTSFFLILNQTKKDLNLSFSEYTSAVMDTFNKDIRIVPSSLKYSLPPDNSTNYYYLNCILNEGSKKYQVYSYLVEHDTSFFDITFKSEYIKDRVEMNTAIFEISAFSIHIDGEFLIKR